MTDGRVACRYAKALFELAEEQKAVPEWGTALNSVVCTLWGDQQLNAAFLGSFLSRSEKKNLLERLFGDRLPMLMLNFLKLLLDKERQAFLPDIRDAYQERMDEWMGLLRIKVTSPTPLNEEQEKQLAEQLESSLGTPVRVSVSVDESLIGGIVLQIGDKLYDGSVKHQIALLQKAMEG